MRRLRKHFSQLLMLYTGSLKVEIVPFTTYILSILLLLINTYYIYKGYKNWYGTYKIRYDTYGTVQYIIGYIIVA
jgi:hypothetical protein